MVGGVVRGVVGGGQTEKKTTATINGLEDKECHLFFFLLTK